MNKIVITAEGAETLARLYDGSKVVKSATAKCSPDDKFSFKTGAKLAFERLTKEDKPAAQEEIQLYCVKEYSTCLTKDKVYKIGIDKMFGFDFHYSESFVSLSDFERIHPQLTGCLVPLVKRSAKKGEWIYIATADATGDTYSNGDLLQVTEHRDGTESHSRGTYAKTKSGKTHPTCAGRTGEAFLYDAEYLVLDGYKPEEEKKPERLNGKFVCIKSDGDNITTGKVYTFVDGQSKYNSGERLPFARPAKSLDDLNSSFWSEGSVQFAQLIEDKK
jgi:hypothetical protein